MAAPWEDFQNDPQGPWNDFVVQKADPKIGQPEDLTFAEKYVAPVLEKLGVGDVAGGNLRGSAVGGAFQGAADPGIAIVQGAANLASPFVVPDDQGRTLAQQVNQGVKNEEAQYQQSRQAAGRSGVDLGRLGGNAAMSTFMAAASPASLPERLGTVGKGVVAGFGQGLLQPVTDGGDNYFAEKGKQGGIGAVTGGATSLLGSLLARVVSPKASVNPDVQLLRDEGVQPTVGGVLGGPFKAMEEKATSFDPTGSIRGAQGRALETFDKAALNRMVAPIGETVDDVGNAGYAQAKRALQDAYQRAAGNVNHVGFDTPEFNSDLGTLTSMAEGLAPDMSSKFESTLKNVVLRRMSPNGSILGSDLKTVDGELGKIASNYAKSSVASERETGDAIFQLQSILRQQVARSDPTYAAAQAAADAGWKNLIPVRAATKAAINNEGVFTPAQLGTAVRGAARGDSASMGTATMQDLAQAGQNVIGNKVPNSGTVDRLTALGALFHPEIYLPTAMMAAGAYSRPVQNALVSLIADRPDSAPIVANYLRQLMLPATRIAVPAIEQGRR